MTGVVKRDHPAPFQAYLKRRDAAQGVTETSEGGEIDAKSVREQRQEHEVVGDGADDVLTVLVADGLNGFDRPVLHVYQPLASGHRSLGPVGTGPRPEQLGVTLPQVVEGEAFELADVHLDETRFDLDGKVVHRGNRLSRFDGSEKGAGVNGGERFRGEGGCDLRGLTAAFVSQRHIGTPQREGAAI